MNVMIAQKWVDTHRYTAMMSLGVVLLFALGDYVLPFSQEARHWWADAFWTVVSLMAALRCFAVARTLPGRLRTAWWMFGAGCLAWFGGMLAWDYHELLAGEFTPFPALSDIGFLLLAPFFAAGLFYYRAEKPSAQFTLMEFSQFGIFIACIVAAHVVIFYEPILSQQRADLFVITAVAYPVLYMALLFYAVTSLYFYAHGPARQVLVLVVAGVVVQAVTHILYAYALLGHDYQAGNYLDVAWIAGFMLTYYGAVKQATLVASKGIMSQPAFPRELRFGRLMPPLALLTTVMVVIVFRDNLRPEMIDILIPVVVCLLVCLALREWASSQLEESLSEAVWFSEEKLRQTALVAPVGIFRTDAKGECVYANAYSCEIVGLTPAACMGRGWMNSLHPDDRERVISQWSAAVVAERNFRDEYRLIHASGEIIWVLGAAVPERDGAGKLIGYVGSLMDITARREMELALRESEERFRKVFASSPVLMSITRKGSGVFLDVNAAFLETTGWRRDEIIGRTSLDMKIWMAPQDRGHMLARLQSEVELNGADWCLRTKTGEIRDVLGSIEVVSLGGEDCIVVVAQDITDRKRTDAQMLKLSSALEQTADAVMITDRHGVIEYVNTAFEQITGYQSGEMLGKQPNLLNSRKQGQEFYRDMWANILAGKIYSDVFINKKKDGEFYYEEKTITPLKDEKGIISHFVSTGRDITERMRTQERLQFLAHHDVLTELPNRSLFLDRLKQSLAYARWHERLVAVLFLDIDRFKNINDTLGHEAGDCLLQELAVRLGGCLRERDTVARFGGDEFVILLNDVAVASDVNLLAQKILDVLKPPFSINETSLHITASIGISLFPGDGEDSGSLLRNADNAMYRAKELGRNNYQFYSSEMGARALARLTLENSLRRALERNEFVLHYQPQVDARNGQVVGVEALLRWQHPEFGLMPPVDFVPLLEETGLIVPVGQWVLQTACEQLAQWRQQGWPSLRMAVNISSRQFEHASLPGTVADALSSCGLAAADLELEITESILMHQGPATASALEALTGLGVRIGMDDFGTGYSSLGYLRRFPIDTLKIDRSFIRDIPGDPEDAAITHAIIVMGQSLKLELVAEGVETAEQRAFLLSHQCYLMQGYFFSQPLPPEGLTRYLASVQCGQGMGI
ncbi:MAG: EAL domain-containing protein [Pseudomonadota bacterium]